MSLSTRSIARQLGFVLCSIFVGAALAGQPDFAGGNGNGKGNSGNSGNSGNKARGADDRSRSKAPVVSFADQQRLIVRDYYGDQFKSGRCPPGLAKKNNGCQPPGQAKKWERGRPLPRDVVYYDVPQALVVKIGIPPAGHKYVRVAGDILLIAIGTAMVIDAIENLGR